MSFKECTKCNHMMPFSQFGSSNRNEDGLTKFCNVCRANHRVASRKYRAKPQNFVKSQAQSVLSNALKSGKLIKPKCCQICEKDKPLHAHHHSYAHPLYVSFICAACHKALHLNHGSAPSVDLIKRDAANDSVYVDPVEDLVLAVQ